MELEQKRPLYRQQIEQSLPELSIESWDENREGMVNDVVIINNDHIFRFPQNDHWAVEDLWAEANFITHLRHYVEMPLPQFTVYDGELIGHPFAGYPMIPGQPLQRFELFNLPFETQDAIAKQIGVFLTQLHTMPVDSAKKAGIGQSLTNRSVDKWLELYEDVQKELFPHLMGFQKEWVHHHFAPLKANPVWMTYEQTIMNGDLAPYHMLFNSETQRLNGIIDFGTAGFGDPACDFACLLDQYGEEFVQQVASYYPSIEGLIERARFRSGTLWLQWALGGLRNPEDPSWFFVHLGRARGAYPIRK